MDKLEPKKYEDTESSNKSIKTFISGGIAGSVAKTLVAPIDRAKILRQVHNAHYEGYGIFESFYRIVQKEGFFALYKGNGAQMLRIFPYAAMQFTSYEAYKNLNRKIFVKTHDNLFNSIACGSLAGITAVSFTYPLDVIRSRLAFQYTGEHIYFGIVDAIRKIYAENGSITSFYRGYGITLIGMIPYAGLSFTSYERIKKLILKNQIKNLSTTSSSVSSLDSHTYHELTVPGKLVCGALTGIVAQTITYPLDVVRRHMQLSIMFKDKEVRCKMGIFATLKFILKNYGIVKGLYRGITLNYIRAVPMVSTSFCFFELSKKFFGLEIGEHIAKST
jgi:solute carrier family 25 protein 16